MLRYKTNLAPFLNIEPLQIHLSTKILRDFHTDNRFTHGSIPYKDLSWSNQANIGYFYKINLPKKNNCSSLYYINEWFVYIPAYSLIYPLENKKSGCSRRKNSGVPRQATRPGNAHCKNTAIMFIRTVPLPSGFFARVFQAFPASCQNKTALAERIGIVQQAFVITPGRGKLPG
ncbi:MAG: hypothetical protein LKH78_03855 [Weizmannia coagulans]|jgi:hypothetical protein|nr:hypothetical protein [Heyndrickxia coagulans]